MPCPVSAFTYRPSSTLILLLIGSSTERVLLSFMSAPDPSALQCSSLTPQPMNSTANLVGKVVAPAVSPKDNDGRNGRAMVTPAPRRTARRDIFWVILIHLS